MPNCLTLQHIVKTMSCSLAALPTSHAVKSLQVNVQIKVNEKHHWVALDLPGAGLWALLGPGLLGSVDRGLQVRSTGLKISLMRTAPATLGRELAGPVCS